MKVKFANNDEEVEAILSLRYDVLRKPWNQPKNTATDELEKSSFNAFIADENGKVLACGRLQENENKIGQIRFMAVHETQQGKGLGKEIIKCLEKKASELGLKSLELQARENAVEFYKANGYAIKEKSFLLWGIIQHFLMTKKISS